MTKIKIFLITRSLAYALLTLNCQLLLPTAAFSQGVGINIAGNPPNSKALLDIDATGMSPTAGVLVPRMTTSDRNAITAPVPESLLIYNTDSHCFEAYYNGGWVSFGCLGTGCQVPAQPTAGTNTASQTSIVWNWSNASSPASFRWGTTTIYSSATDNGTNVSYTQTGLTCGTAYTLYVWAYNTCGNSSMTTLTQTSSSCSFTCGNSFTVVHTAGTVAPVSRAVTYGTVSTTLTGATECWITQNLGAINQASSATDATAAAAGWYWEWDLKQGYSWNSSTSTLTPSFANSNGADTSWITANDPCNLLLGSGWRIPTKKEWTNASANGGWGIGSTPGYTDTYASVLKLHAAGGIWPPNPATQMYFGSYGFYWSSLPGLSLDFNSFEIYGNGEETLGFTLRCLNP